MPNPPVTREERVMSASSRGRRRPLARTPEDSVAIAAATIEASGGVVDSDLVDLLRAVARGEVTTAEYEAAVRRVGSDRFPPSS